MHHEQKLQLRDELSGERMVSNDCPDYSEGWGCRRQAKGNAFGKDRKTNLGGPGCIRMGNQ